MSKKDGDNTVYITYKRDRATVIPREEWERGWLNWYRRIQKEKGRRNYEPKLQDTWL